MHRKQRTILMAVLTTFLIPFFLLLNQEARAIPAFARKYGASCQVCHVAFPKLNAFGEAFRNNGYRFPEGDEEAIQQRPVTLGVPAWKKVWPKAVWPSDIPPSVPLALLITSTYEILPDNKVSNDFVVPNEVELFTGGTLGESFSFYGGITLLDKNEFGGLHRLFGQFNRLGGTSVLNVKFGGFEPRATPFSSHRRLTLTNYLVNNLAATTALLADGEIVTGHGHGTGTFSLGTSQRGIELWGASSGPGGGGLEWAFGVTNGNGLGGGVETAHGEEAAAEAEEHDAHGMETLDDTASKDIYARFSYKFFGLGRSGLTGPTVDDAENWVDNSLRLGAFIVRGSGLDRAGGHDTEDYRRYGFDLDLWFRNLNLYGAYMFGNNELEDEGAVSQFDLNSWFVEADYVLLPWIVPALRYEVADVKPVTLGGLEVTERLPTLRRVVPHVTLLLRSNVKLAAESNHYFNDYADELYRFNLDFAF
ncbi:hypothetical protein MYX82_01970 [Acidobacteria bacterium AH-259-D05]|nr:hypothetical protein [Acidobacteria bacterium AH-259-D05]